MQINNRIEPSPNPGVPSSGERADLPDVGASVLPSMILGVNSCLEAGPDLESLAKRIDDHHRAAVDATSIAQEHARQAGELLLQAKAMVGHGRWLDWLKKNSDVSERQAERYMRAAKGIGSSKRKVKSDTMSDLTIARSDSGWPVARWLPEEGHWHCAVLGKTCYFVVPSLEHPTFFHISRIPLDESAEDRIECLGTRRPVAGTVVESFLVTLGLSEPWNADWTRRNLPGISAPYLLPEGDDVGTLIEAEAPLRTSAHYLSPSSSH